MKIFLLQALHPTVGGHVIKTFASKRLAEIEAAKLTNILLEDHQDDNGKPFITFEATAETWSCLSLAYRQSIADQNGIDLDAITDDDAGDVWIEEVDLIGSEGMTLVGFSTITLSDDSRISTFTTIDAVGIDVAGPVGKTEPER